MMETRNVGGGFDHMFFMGEMGGAKYLVIGKDGSKRSIALAQGRGKDTFLLGDWGVSWARRRMADNHVNTSFSSCTINFPVKPGLRWPKVLSFHIA